MCATAKVDTFVWTSTGGRTTWQNFKWVSHCSYETVTHGRYNKYGFFFPRLSEKSGQPSRRPEDACGPPNFDAHSTDSITLVGKSLIAKIFQVFVERPSAISR